MTLHRSPARNTPRRHNRSLHSASRHHSTSLQSNTRRHLIAPQVDPRRHRNATHNRAFHRIPRRQISAPHSKAITIQSSTRRHSTTHQHASPLGVRPKQVTAAQPTAVLDANALQYRTRRFSAPPHSRTRRFTSRHQFISWQATADLGGTPIHVTTRRHASAQQRSAMHPSSRRHDNTNQTITLHPSPSRQNTPRHFGPHLGVIPLRFTSALGASTVHATTFRFSATRHRITSHSIPRRPKGGNRRSAPRFGGFPAALGSPSA
jgi:hypothetical protein